MMTCPPFKFYSGNNGLLGQKDTISKVSNALNLCFKLTCVCCGSVILDEWWFDPWCLVVFLPSFSNLLSEMSPSAERDFHGSLRKLSSCMAHSFSFTHSLYIFVWQQNASGSTVTSDNSIAGRNKLDVLKNKARSSLTSSLENIFSRVCVCVVRLYLSSLWMGIDPFTPPLYWIIPLFVYSIIMNQPSAVFIHKTISMRKDKDQLSLNFPLDVCVQLKEQFI